MRNKAAIVKNLLGYIKWYWVLLFFIAYGALSDSHQWKYRDGHYVKIEFNEVPFDDRLNGAIAGCIVALVLIGGWWGCRRIYTSLKNKKDVTTSS